MSTSYTVDIKAAKVASPEQYATSVEALAALPQTPTVCKLSEALISVWNNTPSSQSKLLLVAQMPAIVEALASEYAEAREFMDSQAKSITYYMDKAQEAENECKTIRLDNDTLLADNQALRQNLRNFVQNSANAASLAEESLRLANCRIEKLQRVVRARGRRLAKAYARIDEQAHSLETAAREARLDISKLEADKLALEQELSRVRKSLVTERTNNMELGNAARQYMEEANAADKLAADRLTVLRAEQEESAKLRASLEGAEAEIDWLRGIISSLTKQA